MRIRGLQPFRVDTMGVSADSDPTWRSVQKTSPRKMELQEFAPLDKMLASLPKKAQRGLTNLNIEYMCVDANKDFIVLGANIPITFVYDRKDHQLLKLKCDDRNCQICCVRIVTCLDHQLAVGTTNSKVEVYLIPAKLPGRTKEVKKFVLNNVHKGSVTCAEWSTNGMKLFTGDTTGGVVYTEVDFYQNKCTPIKIIHEDSPVVQLSYAYKILIVSTYNRTILCYTDDNYRIQQAGQQARKSKGLYGAHFIPAVCKPKDAKLYASRPGLRLWRVGSDGQVLETVMYKDLVSAPHNKIPVQPDLGLFTAVKPAAGDLQFGPLLIYMESYVLSWSQSFLVILDPSNPSGASVLASNQGKIGSIMSVAVCEDEIFVLRRGAERPLIRIATQPDVAAIKEHVKFSPEELERLQQLNPPIVLQQDVNKTSKITQSVKSFFSKAADELSEDAARFTESIKEGALEIKHKAAQLKKDTKDEGMPSQEAIPEDVEGEEREDDDQDDDEEEEDNDDLSEIAGDAQMAPASNEKVKSQSDSATNDSSESNNQESVQDKAKPRTSSIMGALAAGLQVAGLVAAGSPQEESTSVEASLEAKETAEDTSPQRFDDEMLKKLGEVQYDDIIVQPKPVKKKKKKTKGAKKKDGANGADVASNSDNGNAKASSQQEDIAIVTDNDYPQVNMTRTNEGKDENAERTRALNQFSNGMKDSSSIQDQNEQIKNEPRVYQDVTLVGSDAKSLVTPHGSVTADQQRANILASEVASDVTLTNGNDPEFANVTALASSEPSKPRLNDPIIGSYPGEAIELEGDLPRTLQSAGFLGTGANFDMPSDDDNPSSEDPVILVSASSAGNTLSGLAPQEFQIDTDEDSTEKIMGSTDEEVDTIGHRNHSDSFGSPEESPKKSPGTEDEFDFYGRYRTPTMAAEQHPQTLPVTSPMRDEMSTSGESSQSAEDIPIPENIQQKLAGSWMQCAVPGFISQLHVSERNIWCVDNHDKIYHTLVNSVNYKWSKLKDSAMQVAVSPSESIVWRVHRRTGLAYASAPITSRSPVGSKWEAACKDVAFVCLDENMAWIIKTSGQICVHKNISRDRPYTRNTQVDSNMPIELIAAYRGVVWGLNNDKTVVFRTDISSVKPQGRLWREVTDSFRLRAVSIALDGKNNGWAIDEDGVVWFRTDVTADTPQGREDKWWQVPMGEYLMQDPYMLQGMFSAMASQSALERVDKVTGHVAGWLKKLSPIYKATHLAASSAGVWVCGAHHYKSTMHVSKGNLLGSRWEQAGPIGLPSSVIWSDVSASGVYAYSGMIWALQKGGEVFCFPPDSRKPHLVEPPVGISFKQLSAAPEAVWGLDDRGNVFIRMGVSQMHPHGVVWKKLDLNQLGIRKVVHICCGANVVWACDHEGGMHFRIGVTMPQSESLPPAWVPVDGKASGYGTFFTQVAVGGQEDSSVWAIDNRKNVYVRKDISKNMPIGMQWEQVEGTTALQICISSQNVWALCPNGDIACRFGVTEKNPMGDYWKKVPGNFAYLTVSQSDDLWAINNEGHLYQRFTKMFQRHQPGTLSSPDPDEWELL